MSPKKRSTAENLITFQKIASKLKSCTMGRFDFGAVYNEWAENEYEPLFGGGSPFWRHFPVPWPENRIISECCVIIKIARKCSKIPLKLCILGWDRRREACDPETAQPTRITVLGCRRWPCLQTVKSGPARSVL